MKQSLEELLRSMKTMPDASIDDSFRKNAKIRILNVAVHTMPAPKLHGLAWISYHISRLVSGTFVASLLVGGSLVYAAQYSKPGSPLYAVKTASEQAALQLAPTNKIKTSVAATVVDRRAEEVGELKTSGTKQEVNQAIFEYHDTVRKLERTRGVDMTEIETHVREHKRTFESEEQSDRQSEVGEREGVKSSVSPRPAVSVMPTITTHTVTPTITSIHTDSQEQWKTQSDIEVKTTEAEVQGVFTEKQSGEKENHTTSD